MSPRPSGPGLHAARRLMGRRFLGIFGNEASTRPTHRKPALRGRRYAIPFERVWTCALELIERERPRWTVVDADDREGTIRVEARTRVFGFVDDVHIRVALDENAQTRVDLGSRSRVGKWDLGTNARRIRRFLRDLDRALEARSRDILPPGPIASRAPESSEPG